MTTDAPPVSDAPLDEYVRAKHTVAQSLHVVKDALERTQRVRSAEAIRQLLVRLAEDRFNFVVLGQFKRGKSSLINAIVERQILPTAVVPLTSVVTSLRFGYPERAIIRIEGNSLPTKISISELAAYVTERGTVMLVSLLDRAVRVLEEEQAADPDGGEWDELLGHVITLRDSLLTGRTGDEVPLPGLPVQSQLASAPVPAEEEQVPPALAGPDCPICIVAWKTVYDFLCHWQYALSTDPPPSSPIAQTAASAASTPGS